MRIHTNKLRASDARDALERAQASGRIARSVRFKELVEHGSKSHETAFEIQLESYSKLDGDGRRAGSSGSYGDMTGADYAATYDEWGWLLSELYALDPAMVCGSVRYPNYADRADFDDKTGWSYAPEKLIQFIETRGFDPYPFVQGGTSGHVGRIGAGRTDADTAPWQQVERAQEWYASGHTTMKADLWLRYAPRSITNVQVFAKLGELS